MAEIDKADLLREVRFHPYRLGCGPTFTLRLYAPPYGLCGDDAHLGYELSQCENGRTTVLFEGADFRPSPLHGWDSDQAISALMGFLTLRKGDTDAEYFEAYTITQATFRDTHAELLDVEVRARFGDA